MPFIKIYIHLVFSTKNRIPYFNTPELRIKVWKHIKEHASQKGIFLDMVNGYSDHCHCLISLGSNQNIEKIVQLLKENLHIGSIKMHWQKKSFFGRMNILLFQFLNLWLKQLEITLKIRKVITKRNRLRKNIRNFWINIILNNLSSR